MAKLLLQKQSHLSYGMNLFYFFFFFFRSAISLGPPEILKKKLNCGVRLDICIRSITAYICGVPRGSKAPIRVDPYFKNTGLPVKIRVDPYFTNLLAFTGRTVKYESIYNLRVDPCIFPERN